MNMKNTRAYEFDAVRFILLIQKNILFNYSSHHYGQMVIIF